MWYRTSSDPTDSAAKTPETVPVPAPEVPAPGGGDGGTPEALARDSVGVPVDLDAHIAQEIDASQQRAWEYADKYGLPRGDLRENGGASRIDAHQRAWAEETRRAHQAAQKAIATLQAALPESARVNLAGSLGQGQFFDKGRRDYDLDVHLSGLNLPPSDGRDRVPLPADAIAAISQARKVSAPTVLDVFVSHEGKLWVVNGSSLSRQPGLFGKQKFQRGNGTRSQGAPMAWDDFQQSFYHGLGPKPDR